MSEFNVALPLPLPLHGGDIDSASTRFGISKDCWQDLSTGISPWVWPVPNLAAEVWQRLPQIAPLIAAARQYYGVDSADLVATVGSQWAIRRIPQLLAKASVAIPVHGYQEHCFAWQQAGHAIHRYANYHELQELLASGRVEHVVVINPNNPEASYFSRAQLLALHESMASDSLLLVDEAFADYRSTHSLTGDCDRPGLVVLRSLGKFFGLAGLRLGFVMGRHRLLNTLALDLSPWAVSGPAIYLGQLALLDTAWQSLQRNRIALAVERLTALVAKRFPHLALANGGLFVTVFGPVTELLACYEHAAQQAVLLRFFQIDNSRAWLRIGLADDNFRRLEQLWQD